MPCCTGGHLTVPYEQYTQQSPGIGWKIAWQAAHSWNHRHALVGMVSRVDTPHSGQVRTDSSSTGDIGKPRCAEKSAPARVPRAPLALRVQRLALHARIHFRQRDRKSTRLNSKSLMRISYAGLC